MNTHNNNNSSNNGNDVYNLFLLGESFIQSARIIQKSKNKFEKKQAQIKMMILRLLMIQAIIGSYIYIQV